MSLLNDKNKGTSSQANTAVAKPGLSKIPSPHWIIYRDATDNISSSPKLFLHEDKNVLLPPVLFPSEEKANIVAKGCLPLNSVYYLRDVLCVPTFKGGRFPSQTLPNPKEIHEVGSSNNSGMDEVKAIITLRSGKQVDQPMPKPVEESRQGEELQPEHILLKED